MQSTPNTFRHWHMPKPHEVGNNHVEFINILKGPTWITIEGKDNSRQRAIVTLLHGNEPSGLKAIHRLLQDKIIPATNLGIFIVSVNAAQLRPYFSHRYLPDEADFNRCFPKNLPKGSSNSLNDTLYSAQERLAIKITDTLREKQFYS
jgi:predicted deacylase